MAASEVVAVKPVSNEIDKNEGSDSDEPSTTIHSIWSQGGDIASKEKKLQFKPTKKTHTTMTDCEVRPKRTKRKTRNPEEWSRNKISRLRNSGKEYIDRMGHYHREKKVQPFIHKCRFDCQTFTEDERLEIFEKFWALGNYEYQSAFMNQTIQVTLPDRARRTAQRHRTCSAVYTFSNRRVCKEFYMKTLDVSNGRVSILVRKKIKSETLGISPCDQRGRKTPKTEVGLYSSAMARPRSVRLETEVDKLNSSVEPEEIVAEPDLMYDTE